MEDVIISTKSDSLAEIPKLKRLDALPLDNKIQTDNMDESENIETITIHEKTAKASDSSLEHQLNEKVELESTG